MSDEKNLRSEAAPSADSWVVRLTTHLPMSRPRSFFYSSDEWTPELVRATRFPTRQAASAFVEDKGLVTHDVAVLQLLPDGSLMEVSNLRTEGATRGDETDPPSYWLIGHWLGSLYWGPRWGMDCEGNARQFPSVAEAYEQWKRLPADLRRALVLAPSWRNLRTVGATDTTEAAQRGCDGKVADGAGEHSVAGGIDERWYVDLRSEAASASPTGPSTNPHGDAWYIYLALHKPVYLGEGEEVWWTRSKASARKFTSSEKVHEAFGRLTVHLGTKLYICCDPGPPRITFEQALRSEGAPVVAHGTPLSASADAQGSLTVHLGTDEDGNVVSTMPEVRAAIEATGFRKMGPEEEKGMETYWLLWHKHDNSYLGRPGGFDEEGLATHFPTEEAALAFRHANVSDRIRSAVVAVSRSAQGRQALRPTQSAQRGCDKIRVDKLLVVAAAVWQEGMIYSLPRPARHHDILHKLHALGLPAAVGGPYSSLEQGFLLSDGAFAGRERAAKLALATGQVQKLHAPPELYSEDLW